jgi:hypothetical protein
MGKKHEHIIQLLPWFVNDSLGNKEQALVLSHLSDCRVCQTERDRLQQFQALIVDDDTPLSDYRFSFRSVMARIEAAEKNRESTGDLAEVANRWNWLPALGLAASVSVIAIVMALVAPSKTEEYRTLTTVTAPSGQTHRLALTFVQPIKAQTMRQALIDTNSYLVSGPDDTGAYIVDIRVPDQLGDAQFISSLRKIEGVEDATFIHR